MSNGSRPAREILVVLERKLADLEAKKAATTDKSQQAKYDEDIADARSDAVAALRSYVMSEYMQAQLASKFPRSRVRKDVQVWQEQDPKYKSIEEFKAGNKAMFEKSRRGVKRIDTPDGPRVFLEVTDIDLMVTMDQPGGQAKILHTEELKTGSTDSPKAARALLDASTKMIEGADAGGARVRLFENGKDITAQIGLASIQRATSATRGPANKSFQESFGIAAKDLDALIIKILNMSSGTDGPR